jgi:uncharacterized protein YoxC
VSEDAAGAPGYSAGPGNPVAERMQALLSRAVEDQISEQRTVANALADVRGQVAAVGEGLRGAASGVAVERLRTDLAAVATELRMSTTGLGERFDVLARRLDEQAAAIAGAGSGSAELTGQLDGLANGLDGLAHDVAAHGAIVQRLTADIAAQGVSVQRLTTAVQALAAFPEALAALQKDLAGLHDRLSPLADIRTAVAELQSRESAADIIRPELEALITRVERVSSSADVARMRDSVVLALTERIDVLAASPAISPEQLSAALTEVVGPLQSRLDGLAAGGPALDRLQALDARLHGLEEALGQLGDRVGQVGDAAGGIPAVATDLHRLTLQVEGLGGVTADVAGVRERMDGLATVAVDVAGLRHDVDEVGTRVAGLSVPTTEQISAAVAARLADRLVDELSPRVADVVLDRIGPVVAQQVGEKVAASILDGVEASTAQAEGRLRTHMDEAILTLAEALLRKRRPNRSWAPEAAADEDDDEEGEPAAERSLPLAPQPATPEPAAAARLEPRKPAPPAPKLPGPVDRGDDGPEHGQDDDQARSTVHGQDDRQDEDDARKPAALGFDEVSAPKPAPPARPSTRTAARAAARAAARETARETRETRETARPTSRPAGATGPTVLPAEPASRRAPAAVDVDDEDDDDGIRRRPWWRPGG